MWLAQAGGLLPGMIAIGHSSHPLSTDYRLPSMCYDTSYLMHWDALGGFASFIRRRPMRRSLQESYNYPFTPSPGTRKPAARVKFWFKG